jgi:hypothetical protein
VPSSLPQDWPATLRMLAAASTDFEPKCQLVTSRSTHLAHEMAGLVTGPHNSESQRTELRGRGQGDSIAEFEASAFTKSVGGMSYGHCDLPNEEHPHSALAWKTPEEFAREHGSQANSQVP